MGSLKVPNTVNRISIPILLANHIHKARASCENTVTSATSTASFLRINDYLGSFATPLAVHIYGAKPHPASDLPILPFLTEIPYCTPAALSWKCGYDLVGILTYMPIRQRAFRWKTVQGYAPPQTTPQMAVSHLHLDIPALVADHISTTLGAKGLYLVISPKPWGPTDVWQMYACFGLLRICGILTPWRVTVEEECHNVPGSRSISASVGAWPIQAFGYDKLNLALA
ncbi:hypothetical protein HDV00_012603 [Rhizophlyctis rosea]|nr:hypothetical protein HDV00_012603 [Rhizophlyctis rosea]